MKPSQLSSELQQAFEVMNITKLTPIQTQAIPTLLEGKDLTGQAQTGTGKTAAFAIPAIEQIDIDNPYIQVLVMCPTRELAIQVTNEFKKLAQFKTGVKIISIYGGQSIETQKKVLKKRPQIVVGTPGRVKDMCNRGYLKLHQVNTFVLDEADEILNMGFRPDIEAILKRTPKSRQTVFFSATMPQSIIQLADTYQKEAVKIQVSQHDQPLIKIEQIYYEVKHQNKNKVLEQLLSHHQLTRTIVFCNTKWKVDALVKQLKRSKIQVDGLHGGKTQSQRNRIMDGYRAGKTEVLVATDVAARGLDVHDVEAVFNYDLPTDTAFYVHRIGRTGRAGRSGKAFSFVEKRDKKLLQDIQKCSNATLKRQELPA